MVKDKPMVLNRNTYFVYMNKLCKDYQHRLLKFYNSVLNV